MKRPAVLLCILFFTTRVSGQSIYSTLHVNEERDLHNGQAYKIIKKLVLITSQGKEVRKEVTEYDRHGLPSATWFYNGRGKVSSIYRFRYDTARRVLLETRISESEPEFPVRKVRTEYYYHNSRSPVLICYFDSANNVLSEVMLTNNSLGLPEELRLYEPVGNMMGVEKATYLPEENKAVVAVQNAAGRILSKDTMKISFRDAHRFSDPAFRYNSRGDIVSATATWPDGSRHEKEFHYTYDKMGNWTEQKIYDAAYTQSGKKTKRLRSIAHREIYYRTR